MGIRLHVAVVSVVAAASSAARAQNVEAETLFREGVSLEASGKHAEACEAFAASNQIEQRAGTLLQLGHCRVNNHQLATAWAAFSDALARAKDPAKKKAAEEALRDLEPRLSYVTVSVPEQNHVQGLTLTRNGRPFEEVLWNRRVPVDGGTIVIGGRAPGHEEWKTIVQVPDEKGDVHVEVPRFKELAQLVSPPPAAHEPPAPAAQDPEDEGEPNTPTPVVHRRYLPYGLAGGGIVLGASAVALALWSRANISEARSLCGADLRCAEPAYSRSVTLLNSAAWKRDGAIAAGVLAAASIGTGVYLYVRTRRNRGTRSARLDVTPGADLHAVALFVDGSW